MKAYPAPHNNTGDEARLARASEYYFSSGLPNLELPRLLGCRVEGGRVLVGLMQETSVPGVYAAGEVCGIGGVDAADVAGPPRHRHPGTWHLHLKELVEWVALLHGPVALEVQVRLQARQDGRPELGEDVLRSAAAAVHGLDRHPERSPACRRVAWRAQDDLEL